MAYVAQHPLKTAGAVVGHLGRNRRTQSTLEQLAAVCGENPAQVKFETIGVEHHPPMATTSSAGLLLHWHQRQHRASAEQPLFRADAPRLNLFPLRGL
ncbi:hypothetical protein [Thioflavicoccus mobilis]|uniref:hypothetical protein n=1 Tax=Thioflavicoccus mobilis TaxID=80679 RepID=UPI0012FB62A4